MTKKPQKEQKTKKTKKTTKKKRVVKVFLASPGDLPEERLAFKAVCDELNSTIGEKYGVHFEPLGWESVLSCVGKRGQDAINNLVDSCDCFILALFRRWGRKGRGSAYSLTEEEFRRALKRRNKTTKPHIFMFFKNVDSASVADPGPQLTKVLCFRKEVERKEIALFRTFPDAAAFKAEVRSHLIALIKGELPVFAKPDSLALPEDALERIEREKKECKRLRSKLHRQTKKTKTAQDESAALRLQVQQRELRLATKAARDAKEGRIEEARQDFASVVTVTNDIQIISLAVEFFLRTGDMNEAERLATRALALSREAKDDGTETRSLVVLADIARFRGEYAKATRFLSEARDITSRTSDALNQALVYTGLGIIHQALGDLAEAETHFNLALALERKLGRSEGIANACSNLSNVYCDLGKLDDANRFISEALAISNERRDVEMLVRCKAGLGNILLSQGRLRDAVAILREAIDGMSGLEARHDKSVSLSNLGIALAKLGSFDEAFAAFQEALDINLLIGDAAGVTAVYGNMGILHSERGNFDAAEKLLKHSVSIDEQQGRHASVATGLCSLGVVYKLQGDLNKAEEHYKRARSIWEKTGHAAAIADCECDLADIAFRRGNIDEAEAGYRRALDMNQKLKRADAIAEDYRDIGRMHAARGERDKARECYEESMKMAAAIGLGKLLNELRRLLEALSADESGKREGEAPSRTAAPTVTFVVGLCGSGKTTLADRLLREGKAVKKFDENFLSKDFPGQPEELVEELRRGNNCVVVEIQFCFEPVRKEFVHKLNKEVPNVEIKWLCIKNEPDKANNNCRNRRGKDPVPHIETNRQVSPHYTYPEGAVILPTWSQD